MKNLLFFSLVTLTWTGVFLINDKVPLYMPLFMLVGLFSLLTKIKIKLYRSDFALVFFLIYITISGLFNYNTKTLNYLSTYFFVFIFLYLLVRNIFSNFSYNTLSKIITYSVVITLLIIIFDFYTRNFTSISIDNFISRSKEATATFNSVFIRAYAFATEPGVLAYYLSTVGLLPFVFVKNKKLLILYLFLFILAEISIYSATGIVALTTGIIMSVFFNKNNEFNFVKYNKYVLFILILMIIVLTQTDFFDTFITKIMFSENSSSSVQRLVTWNESFLRIIDKPFFGTGIGYLSSIGLGSPISWFLFLAVETGFTGLFLTLLWLFMVSKKIIKKAIANNNYIPIMGLIAGIVHLSVISGFQYPYLFIFIAFFEAKWINNNYEYFISS